MGTNSNFNGQHGSHMNSGGYGASKARRGSSLGKADHSSNGRQPVCSSPIRAYSGQVQKRSEWQRFPWAMGGQKLQTTQGVAHTNVQLPAKMRPVLPESENIPTAFAARPAAAVLLLLACAGSVGAALLRGGAVEWLLCVLVGCIAAFAFLAPIVAVRRLEASRVLGAATVVAGEDVEITLQLTAQRVYPIAWLIVEDIACHEAAPAAPLRYRKLILPWLRREWTLRYSLRHMRRGRTQLGKAAVVIGDLFGLGARRIALPCADAVVALPAPWRGQPLAVPPGRAAAPPEEPDAARSGARPGAGHDSRAYRPGDSPRHIDWRAAAMGRGLHTRVRPKERPADALIILDTAPAVRDEDGRLFDACASLALDAVQRTVAGGRCVRLVCGAGEAGRMYVRPGDQGALRRAAERLAHVQPEPLAAAAGAARGPQDASAPGAGAGAPGLPDAAQGAASSAPAVASAGSAPATRARGVVRPSAAGAPGVTEAPGLPPGVLPRGGGAVVITAGRASYAQLAQQAAAAVCRIEIWAMGAGRTPNYTDREYKRHMEAYGCAVRLVPVEPLQSPAMHVAAMPHEEGQSHATQ